jgi:large subunit ribosomal protein L17
MRHGKKFNHLGRKTGHRSAMLSNMACSLIEHKRINTTVAKAKALRVYIEPIITKSKTDSTHSRRMVFRLLKSKLATAELFRDIAPVVADRPGGYTRIIKTEYRLGDNAEMCLIELVDFNELLKGDGADKKRRSRRSKSSAKATGAPAAKASKETPAAVAETPEADAPVAEVETVVEAVVETPEAVVEEVVEAVAETPEAEVKEESPKAEAKDEEASKEEDNQDKKES